MHPPCGYDSRLSHTLPYDSLITVEHQQGQPLSPDQWAAVRQPTLVLGGGKSDTWIRNGMQALTETLPRATGRVLHGQTHNLRPKAVAPEQVRFFRGPTACDQPQRTGGGRAAAI